MVSLPWSVSLGDLEGYLDMNLAQLAVSPTVLLSALFFLSLFLSPLY